MLNSAPDVRVREMRLEDLDQVFAIEEAAKAFPWSKEMLQQELYFGEASRPLIAEVQNKIAAFVMAWYVADEVHVINLAVHPAFQRRGLATRLMMEVISTARKKKAGRVFLEVRRSNDKAIGLYKKLGFRITGYRPKYYQDSNEDAILMEKKLI